jgi:hypothetical protein
VGGKPAKATSKRAKVGHMFSAAHHFRQAIPSHMHDRGRTRDTGGARTPRRGYEVRQANHCAFCVWNKATSSAKLKLSNKNEDHFSIATNKSVTGC